MIVTASPVAWLGGTVIVTALATSQAAAQFTPPPSLAVPSNLQQNTNAAGGSTTNTTTNTAPNAPTLVAPAQVQPTPATSAPASYRDFVAKAKAGIAEGQTNAAIQAFAQATIAANRAPEAAAELQQLKEQLLGRGVTALQLEGALRHFANLQTAGKNEPKLQVPPNAPMPNGQMMPPALSTPAAPALANQQGPYNPLRDQAAAISAQAKLALARGDLAGARQLIEQAKSLNVPEEAFAIGQLRPWQVQVDLERAERMQASGLGTNVVTASGTTPNGVQQAGGNAPMNNMVQPGVFQPNADSTQIAQASNNQQQNAPPPLTGGNNGEALYRQGVEALTAGQRDKALEYFSQAWKFQSTLDAQTRSLLKDKLTLLQAPQNPQPMRAGAEPITPLQEANNEQLLMKQKLFREVTGEIAESERMVQDQPLEALDRLKLLRQRVSQSPVDGAYRKQMLATVDRVLNNVQAYVDTNRSAIDLAARNNTIETQLANEAANRAKLDSEIQRMVDQFNDLMKNGSYAEAEIVAKKVGEMSPESEISVLMYQNARIKRRYEESLAITKRKEDAFLNSMIDVDEASILETSDEKPYLFPEQREWQALSNRRREFNGDGKSLMTPAEREIREKLRSPVTVSFQQRPLQQAIDTLMDMVGIAAFIDPAGLAAEGFTSDVPVTLDLREKEISLKSALNLMLDPLNLTYVIHDDVLKITSKQTANKKVYQWTYGVKDLVLPIPNFVSDYNSGLAGAIRSAYLNQGQQLLVKTDDYRPGQSAANMSQMASLDPSMNVLGQIPMPGLPANGGMPGLPGMGGMGGFPGNNFGGPPAMGTMPPGGPIMNGMPNNSLGGGAIADFQSLINLIETTIDGNWESDGGTNTISEFRSNLSLVVRADQETHEAIAELLTALRRLQNLQVTIEVRFITLSDTFFERVGIDFEIGFDNNADTIPPEDQGPSVTVGLGTGLIPTADLDVRFSQESFTATPPFGGFDAASAGRFGVAILSDIELFFLLEAASGDSRTNVLQAPKVTMFDGQAATINDTANRPFVLGLTPVVGDFAVAQQPIIVVLSDGTNLTVQSVVTPDKRFVRMTLVPMFTRIENADRTFTFTGTRRTNTGNAVFDPDGNLLDDRDDEETIVEGSTVQLPTLGTTSIGTTVVVPDGGTILLGGIKRLSEGRTERGIPFLKNLPYINRLFKNVGIGRQTSTLMMTVTPRIIIPEEEEEKVTGTAVNP